MKNEYLDKKLKDFMETFDIKNKTDVELVTLYFNTVFLEGQKIGYEIAINNTLKILDKK